MFFSPLPQVGVTARALWMRTWSVSTCRHLVTTPSSSCVDRHPWSTSPATLTWTKLATKLSRDSPIRWGPNQMEEVMGWKKRRETGCYGNSNEKSESRFSTKMLSYQLWGILSIKHYKDEMVSWLSYLYHENFYTWKGSLYIEMGPREVLSV